jgi:PAS domain S-box-containing protein
MASEVGDVRGKKLRFESSSYSSMSDLATQLADSIGRQLGCDEVLVTIGRDERLHTGHFSQGGESLAENPLFEIRNGAAMFRGQAWSLPFVVKDLQRARVPNDLALELAVRKVRSYGAFPLMGQGRLLGIVECYFTRSYHRWHPEEIVAFEELSHALSGVDAAGVPATGRRSHVTSEESRSQYARMAQYGNVLIIITDAQFGITEVFGDAESMLGISAAEMKNNSRIWERIIDPRDQSALHRRILRLRLERGELREEVRAIHQKTGQARWVMLRAVPQFSTNGGFLGWEGFGIDITDRRGVQDALATQNARVEALFEVARALQGQTDPALVILRGVRALLKATGSSSGYGCFYQEETDEVELVAVHGLSENYIQNMDAVLKGPSLLREAISSKRGVMIGDIQEHPRAHTKVAEIEDLRSAILMPLIADDRVYGALVIFTRERDSYKTNDFDLVSAAATQIALAVRQTYLFDAERQQSQTLSALYRISHELAKYRTPKEIAEHAFPILQQEFTLRRGWFGVTNEQGTHVVGKAGFGAGVRRKLQEVQIELSLQHDFLDEAIKTQRPVVVPAGATMECSGLQRVVTLLKLETFVIVPLISLGQVIGVLVLEPAIPHLLTKGARLHLLSSMANEMAQVLMARRFESRMAEGLKMRMAGLLASGVAHNFNNMLQAILGQVALLEMQLPKGAPAFDSARMITDAAKRGAELVSQLINFASQEQGTRQRVSVAKLITDSQELYRSLLGKRVQFNLRSSDYCPDAVLDPNQIQQVITNLLMNAKEAIDGRSEGMVSIAVTPVRLRSAEVDPELSPGEYVRVDVKDNGHGMNAEQQVRCFEPFFTTKNVDPGTGVGLSGSGLGLSAAYSIVKQHNGLITVTSQVGEGSTFSIYLPLQIPGDKVVPLAPHAGPRRLMKGGVLLLGLETGSQAFVSSLLESVGYRSRMVFDVAQARELLERESSAWDCVFVDLDVVREEIFEDCKQLWERFSDLGIVALRSTPRDGVAHPLSAREGFLEKPLGVWSVESLLQRLKATPTSR